MCLLGPLLVLGCATGGRGSLFTPKGTPWTIRCLELQGPDRLPRIERIADTLRRAPGIRPADVFIRREEGGVAGLYYGTHFRRMDPETGRRSRPGKMLADLDLIRQLSDGLGKRYFLRAIPVRMPMPDVGNPEWNLANVSATYSLQVAVFEPTDDFWEYKSAAAKYCAWLRKKGYEAYYYHASASSMITVGSFGPEAVITKADGLTYYSDDVLALQRDELLKYNLLNGLIYRVRKEGRASVRVPSMLVRIPKASGTGIGYENRHSDRNYEPG
jgi:hypothetical protein